MYSWLVKQYYKILEHKKNKYINRLVKKGLTLGENVEIVDTFFFDPSHCFLITIGDNCTIAPNVRLIAHDASTYKHLGFTKIGKIKIENNCFIGDSVIVLPGVIIGEGSIVGAGSVVTKDVPPGSIVAGNPATLLTSLEKYIDKTRIDAEDKKIFDEDYFIEKLTNEKREEILNAVNKNIGYIK
jgi:maltose O-acetyltransferase